MLSLSKDGAEVLPEWIRPDSYREAHQSNPSFNLCGTCSRTAIGKYSPQQPGHGFGQLFN